jgi:hypothetical protein
MSLVVASAHRGVVIELEGVGVPFSRAVNHLKGEMPPQVNKFGLLLQGIFGTSSKPTCLSRSGLSVIIKRSGRKPPYLFQRTAVRHVN